MHVVSERYMSSIIEGENGLAILISVLGTRRATRGVLAAVDGVMLAGSYSSVEPYLDRGHPSAPDMQHDPAHAETTHVLLCAAIGSYVSVLATCLGFQGLSVMFDGDSRYVPGTRDSVRAGGTATASRSYRRAREFAARAANCAIGCDSRNRSVRPDGTSSPTFSGIAKWSHADNLLSNATFAHGVPGTRIQDDTDRAYGPCVNVPLQRERTCKTSKTF
ncbi:gamma-glutamyl-gamma-aminobutyrate hydrolase family protein [Burkholderia territorii]|uniref:gamma-glutamyl-gamma-aminobutyrate hydrolase family protein n=1 Tax=Burkholderia territorii TaxID=1503055 RepID=UPI000B312F8C